MRIQDAQLKIWQTAEDHGWHEGELNIPEKLALIHAEVSEALEDYRKSTTDADLAQIRWNGDKPDGFAIELADIVIRVFDFAEQLDINLETMMGVKMAYNNTRPYRHGGKRA